MLVLFCLGCGPSAITVDMPLHLEDHLDAATITGSELPGNPPETVEWRFDQPQPDWQATPLWNPPFAAATLARTGEGLRVSLTDRTRNPNGRPIAGIHVNVPDWDPREWAEVVIRARVDSASSVNFVRLAFNLREGRGDATNFLPPFQFSGQSSPIVRDGAIQTYRLRVGDGGRRVGGGDQLGLWQQLVLWFATDDAPGSIEVLSVSVVPKGAVYADSSHGVRPVTIGERIRRTLYTHAPGSIAYRVRVPEGGRLDAALGVLHSHDSVTFRIKVRSGGTDATLFDEQYTAEQWGQRSVDLAQYAGQTVTLTLETEAAQPGRVALWGAPTLSGSAPAAGNRPNVIFYVIDGGWADDMSVYGYSRRTTPYLERLAAEGVVFEHAYSTASWTKPSTITFMTSLPNSVVVKDIDMQFEPLPANAVPMADHVHRAGYQTAVFTSNPWAGAISGLERGTDLMRDGRATRDYTSSVELQDDYWAWRDAYPAQPYWVHFQTTDVHEYEGTQPAPVAPFSGMYVTAGRRREFFREWERFNAERARTPSEGSTAAFKRGALEAARVDRVGFFETMRALYDESVAHQDYQIGRLVERLRERGEWENTLLIIAADHGIAAALWDLAAFMEDTMPPPWNEPILRSSISRVPLVFVWPGHIEGGRRFEDPVSMIDVLPTVLDLLGLPQPDIAQGQSLAPLLRGVPGWEARPVILEEVSYNRRANRREGLIEMIDGRWGASLQLFHAETDSANRRPWPLLLFDVWADPQALHPVNEQYPDLVQKYTGLLEAQWTAHRALATRFTGRDPIALTPEQLEQLRALGYIR
jgi:arylsulfatase A-like enzyme